MAVIQGTAGNDKRKGTIGEDSIALLAGNDTADGGFSKDTLSGGPGNDTLRGSYQDDTLDGGDGNDTLNGGSGNDTFNGGPGADRMSGGSGDDTFFFIGAGSPFFRPADGKGDVVDGGTGNDTVKINYGELGQPLNLKIKDWVATTSLPGGIKVRNVELFDILGTAKNDKITGGIGFDTLSGEDGNDILNGGAGNDKLNGGDGDDVLKGGDGNDTLDGQAGNDRLEGGAGNDVYKVNLADGGKTTIVDSGGNDQLALTGLKGNFTAKAPKKVTTVEGVSVKGVENFKITTADQTGFGFFDDAPTVVNNRITTRNGDDEISSGAGNDIVNSGGGNDRIDAGTGADTVNAGDGADHVMLGDAGKDKVDGGKGIDTVSIEMTGTANQTFSVKGKTATIGGEGTVLKNFEIYSIRFWGGNDVVKSVGKALSVTFDGGFGDDTLRGSAGDDTLYGGEGNDVLIGGGGNDYIDAGNGKDRVDAGNGDDIVVIRGGTAKLGNGSDRASYFHSPTGDNTVSIDGGKGIDTAELNLSAIARDMTLQLKPKNTKVGNAPVTLKNIEAVIVFGGSGNDRFTGGALSDTLDGGLGKDVLNGLGGDDFIRAGFGDKADGGQGFDMLRLSFSDQSANFNFKFTKNMKLPGNTVLKNFEQLGYRGGSGRDTVTGGNGNDELSGGAGNDVLRGGKGDDWLTDGTGADKLFGDAGDDTFVRLDSDRSKDVFNGGGGNDTAMFGFSFDTYSAYVDLQKQKDNAGQAENLTLKNIENLYGSGLDDVLLGDGKANVLTGGGGDDVLNGRAGNDTLIGGSGDNTMTGGAGKDRFVFNMESREHLSSFLGIGIELTGNPGDLITDFKRKQDKLVIDRFAFGFDESAKKVALVTGANPKAKGNGPQFLFETDTGRLWFDEDGAGQAHSPELVATLVGVKALSAGDFDFLL